MKETHIRDDLMHHPWRGTGTIENPYLVEFLPNDPDNPLNFPQPKKWLFTFVAFISVFNVTFLYSAYSGTTVQLRQEVGSSQEITTLGISLFVLGFSVGPTLWAPLSEIYGRRILFRGTFGVLTVSTAGCAGSNSIITFIILRFLSGTFGASPMANSGGVIADLFTPAQRGLRMTLFAAAPFLAPVLGPIMAGFTSEAIGWRWVEGILAIFTGMVWIFGSVVLSETYAPVLLQKRAKELSKKTGQVFISVLDKQNNRKTSEIIKKSLARPWALLFLEPIVLVASIYMSILYGTLYMLFGAFPIVYQRERGWSEGIGGLAFLGVISGMMIGLAYMILDNRRYLRLMEIHKSKGLPPAEARLPPSILGSVALPIGIFWFSWTNSPSIHWSVSIIGAAPFGFGMVLVFVSCLNYLVETYTVYAASVLAGGSMLRSLFATAFPLFTSQMYANPGNHWASSIPGFLTLLCLPFPPFMYFWGEKLRLRCKYAAEAAEIMAKLNGSDNEERHKQDEDP